MRFITLTLLLVLLLTFLVEAKEVKVRRGAGRHRNVARFNSNKYHGKATWFIPSIHGGSIGACGEFEGDDEYIVAMNAVQYGEMTRKSGWCFKRVRIYHNGRHVDATVKDACPECKYGDLDLTRPVFKALGHLDTGILKITWHEI